MKKMKVDIRTIKTSHELNEEEGKKNYTTKNSGNAQKFLKNHSFYYV